MALGFCCLGHIGMSDGDDAAQVGLGNCVAG